MIRIFLIAGEASGDRLGAALMAGLKTLTEVEFAGVGGPLMQAEGLTSIFPMDELSVFGIAEVLPKYRHLVARKNQAAAAALAMNPDAMITIDSPDFCLRVARTVKDRSDIRTVHYVAPSVWAWRPGRAAKMAKCIDQVLTLLPFEPPYMEAAGMRADFVGHPVVSEPQPAPDEIAAFRQVNDLEDAPVILALPGSRRGEVSRLMPVFGAALEQVLDRHPKARVVLPAAESVAELVLQTIRGWPGRPLILDPRGMPPAVAAARKRVAFGAADLALAASGTVSLELAASATPMVIAYDMNWLSWQIMSRMKRIDSVTLVNIVHGRNVVPEFLGPDCRPEPIARALSALMIDPAKRQPQLTAMADTMRQLGQGGEPPGLRAAKAVLAGLAET